MPRTAVRLERLAAWVGVAVVARAPEAPAPVGAPHHQAAASAPTAPGNGERLRGLQARVFAPSWVSVVKASKKVHAVGQIVATS